MPVYEIEQLVVQVQKYRVVATTEAEAIVKLFDGDAAPIGVGLDLDLCEDRGLPAEQYPELAEELRQAGIISDESIIPTIISIEQVEGDDPGEVTLPGGF